MDDAFIEAGRAVAAERRASEPTAAEDASILRTAADSQKIPPVKAWPDSFVNKVHAIADRMEQMERIVKAARDPAIAELMEWGRHNWLRQMSNGPTEIKLVEMEIAIKAFLAALDAGEMGGEGR